MTIDTIAIVSLAILLIILVSIQYTLNKILLHNKEILQMLHLIANKTKIRGEYEDE